MINTFTEAMNLNQTKQKEIKGKGTDVFMSVTLYSVQYGV